MCSADLYRFSHDAFLHSSSFDNPMRKGAATAGDRVVIQGDLGKLVKFLLHNTEIIVTTVHTATLLSIFDTSNIREARSTRSGAPKAPFEIDSKYGLRTERSAEPCRFNKYFRDLPADPLRHYNNTPPINSVNSVHTTSGMTIQEGKHQ